MKKSIMTAVAAGVLMAGGIGGWQGSLASQETEKHVNNVVDEIKVQAAEEIKKAFVHEVSEFFESDDLEKSLGIDRDGQAAIEASIKAYIRDYSMDGEKLDEAKASLRTLLESADGLSAEELQDRISGIFREK